MDQAVAEDFQVSVIIPARNAGATISATLASLLAQTCGDWEAIVVDDGSTDDTAGIAAEFAARDKRIRTIAGPRRGVSAARNAGLAAASAEWVLFLDADDTVVPEMLESMRAGLLAAPSAEAVHCGWTCTDPEGRPVESKRCELLAPDLFPLFSNYCGFIIHSCVIRRSQLDKVGGFDETLRTSEDFDLWQRVARIGTRFTAVPGFLSIYRLRPNATWFDSGPFLDDALRVVRRGHAADPRLDPALVPERYRNGAPAANLARVEVRMTMWAVAMALARDEDAGPLLDRLPSPPVSAIDAKDLGAIVFQAVPFTLCRHESSWLELFSIIEARLLRILSQAEARWRVPGLRKGALEGLKEHIVPAIAEVSGYDGTPIVFQDTAVYGVDVESALTDLAIPEGVDRVVCIVRADGEMLGSVIIPVSGKALLSTVLADAIAGRFAWPLLHRLFVRQGLYAEVVVTQEAQRWQVRRSGVALGEFDDDPSENLHDRVGWTLFLQELTGRRDLTATDFYGGTDLLPVRSPRKGKDEAVFELTEPLQGIIRASAPTVTVRATIGGAPVAAVQVPTVGNAVSEASIRLALLADAGMELARTAVREGVLGRPLADSCTLHQRLREAAKHRKGGYVEPLARSRKGSVLVLGAAAAMGSRQMARRLTLPASHADLLLSTAAAGQPSLRVGRGTVQHVLYLPEIKSAGQPQQDRGTRGHEDQPTLVHDRHHFEFLFASAADPWQYTSAYEQTKYEQTLSMLEEKVYPRALEIGCAEGHFTAQLLPHVESLAVNDISEIALRRTLERCASDKVRARQLDLVRDEIEGTYDLIVCSEVLYYMGDRAGLAVVARKLANALEPGGTLISAHANQVQDDPEAPGFDWGSPYGAKTIGATFAALPDLVFEKELRTPLYRIQRFRRESRASGANAREPIVELAENAAPEPTVAAKIARVGSRAAEVEAHLVTSALPILMYHNVAPQGTARLDRWRVTPESFTAQMQYLRRAGFAATTLDEWRAARRKHEALPGRRVLITFDDGYRGFEEYVLPALQANGFPAMLFVPTAHVGGGATWDGADGAQLKLMDWDALRRLRDAGVSIGAHSCTHAQLTDLPIGELIEELAGARLKLQRELRIEADAIAYPFGAWDEAVVRVAGACGYIHGLTTRDGASGLKEDGLSLSRIEVMGHYTLDQFIARLS